MQITKFEIEIGGRGGEPKGNITFQKYILYSLLSIQHLILINSKVISRCLAMDCRVIWELSLRLHGPPIPSSFHQLA